MQGVIHVAIKAESWPPATAHLSTLCPLPIPFPPPEFLILTLTFLNNVWFVDEKWTMQHFPPRKIPKRQVPCSSPCTPGCCFSHPMENQRWADWSEWMLAGNLLLITNSREALPSLRLLNIEYKALMLREEMSEKIQSTTTSFWSPRGV